MLGTPVVTHTSVVFVRLHWFEKRFVNTVRLSRSPSLRLARSRSRTSNDVEESSQGVNGRRIVVLRGSNQPQPQHHQASTNEDEKASNDTDKLTVPRKGMATAEEDVFALMDDSPLVSRSGRPDNTNVLELEQNGTPDPPSETIAQKRNPDQHIAFLEKQNHSMDKMMLRMPAPREDTRNSEGDSHD